MAVIEWLLDADPAIRWQVLQDLTDEPAEVVAAERSRVSTEGWGARLLALQGADGHWGTELVDHIVVPAEGPLPSVADRRLLREVIGVPYQRLAAWLGLAPETIADWESLPQGPDGEDRERYRAVLTWMRSAVGTFFPAWTSTFFTMTLLRDLGLDPTSDAARRAVALVRDNSRWDAGGQPFFSGEVEPCINGRVVGLGAYFGQDVDEVVDRLLSEQLGDGGWNCEAANGSTRSSFHTTICVLEGLLEYGQSRDSATEVTDARLRGEDYLLERGLLRRRSDGEVIDPTWQRAAFPTWWHYDVLRGLDHLRRTGAAPDPRCAEVVELVASKRDDDGRWPLEHHHAGRTHLDFGEEVGSPSRWITLRALRVLAWYDHADEPQLEGTA
jgi:hypothetical protein